MRSIARVRAAPVLLLKRRVLGLKIPTSFWVSFSLVPFFWTSKRKIPATGQPPVRLSGRNRTPMLLRPVVIPYIFNRLINPKR